MIVHSNLNPSSSLSALKTTMLGEGIISSFNPRIIEVPANNNNNNNNNGSGSQPFKAVQFKKSKISLTKSDEDEEKDDDDDDDDDDDIIEKIPQKKKSNAQVAGKFRLQEASEQDIKDYKLTKEIQNIVDTSAVQGRVEMTPAISSAVSYALTALSTRDGELFPANLVALDNFIPLQQVRHTFANLVSICGIINNIRAPNQYYHNRAIDDRNQEASRFDFRDDTWINLEQ